MATKKSLITKRGTIKAYFTKFQSYLEQVDVHNQTHITNIQSRLNNFDQYYNKFGDIQDQLDLLDDIDESVEQQERDAFTDMYFDLLSRANQIISTNEKVKNEATSRVMVSKKYDNMRRDLSVFNEFLESGYNNNKEELDVRVNELKSLWSQFRIDTREGERDLDLEDSYFKILASARTVISNEQHLVESGVSQLKLPSINIPIFNGSYSEWLNFHDSFQALVHSNAKVPKIVKFQYLKSSLKGEAAGVIQALELSDSNYDIAWDLIVRRFQNKRLIIYNHIKALFELNSVQKDNCHALRELIDSFQKHFRSLEALGEPTAHWDTPMVFLITSKLDNVTRREWEEIHSDHIFPKLEELTSFLSKKCIILETLQPKKTNDHKTSAINKSYTYKNRDQLTAHVSTTLVCKICKGEHPIYRCGSFLKLDPYRRTAEIKRLKFCVNCLKPNHISTQCSASKCKTCNKLHNTLLHFDKVNTNDHRVGGSNNVTEDRVVSNKCSNNQQYQVLLSTAVAYIQDINGIYHKCRILLDVGSQANFITKEMCVRLGLTLKKCNIPISGIMERTGNINFIAKVTIRSNYNQFSSHVDCLVVDKITENLPIHTFNKSLICYPSGINLADTNFHVSGPIDLLIGAELFWELLEDNKIKLDSGPCIQETKLGWIIGGAISSNSKPRAICNLSIEPQFSKFWEVEDYEGYLHPLSRDEQTCEEFFAKTVNRDDQGKFIVKLPFKTPDSFNKLGSSKDIAIKRLQWVERKFRRDPSLKQEYCKFMREYIRLNHMTLIEDDQNQVRNCFLPHHAVIKESSDTTRLRVVFDGSATTSTGVSLNDVLLAGPRLQPDLFSLLIRFRLYQYVIIGDIAKMYRMVWVAPEDRVYQQIVWRENEHDPIQTYQLNTVTYGIKSSPYLAIKSLQQLAVDDCKHLPWLQTIILNSFYVDDLICGANSKVEAIEIREQLSNYLLQGGFELRKWVSNCSEILPKSDCTNTLINLDKQEGHKALGLQWDNDQDLLTYQGFDVVNSNSLITKRHILSVISKLFDPLGLVGPILISAKIIMQKIWISKIHWDDPIPQNLANSWENFISNFSNIDHIKIPRSVVSDFSTNEVELHGFCDSSEYAYGACIYIRTSSEKGNFTNLLCSKSRVAPLKTITIPRLELCAAVLLIRLVRSVKNALGLNVDREYFWTDSTVVLSWLSSDASSWKTFVAHRVAEIQSNSNRDDWYHIDTKHNPADIISRGSPTQTLINSSLWWYGPEFLKYNVEFWPSQTTLPLITIDRKDPIVSLPSMALSNYLITVTEKFSNFFRLQRVIAFCLRFIGNLKNHNKKQYGHLTCQELQRATLTILKSIQNREFSKEIILIEKNKFYNYKGKLKLLTPFIDDSGLLRVGGRLNNAPISFDKRHPILLPAKNHVTNLLIKQAHEVGLHGGHDATLYSLRQHYWPIGGRSAVRKIVHQCMRCFKTKPKPTTQLMGNLPLVRVEPSRPFLNTGIDYAGPLLLREFKGRGKKQFKVYVALFICLSTKAVHLELVGDLTTESFLATLKRFFARRGHAANLYLDNGANFVGASRKLLESFKSTKFQNKITTDLSSKTISWHFIPPRSPTFGGLWEINIKSVKTHLKRILGNAVVTYEEMCTALAQIEACLNSRPLTPLTSDPNDLSALTPGHFLIGAPLTTILEPELIELRINRLTRWQRIQQLQQHFWRRWQREYLSTQQQRQKWHHERIVTPGQMVILHEDNTPPLIWKLGRIVETHQGTDGLVRVVSIRTKDGLTKRGLNRISILPFMEEV